MDGVPYVYLVKNKTTGLKYIGAKYAKGCDPRLFWVTYFTSSKRVAQLLDLYGKEDFSYKILKTFSSQYDCLEYENKLIELSKNKRDYLNIHCNFITSNEETYEEGKDRQRQAASKQGIISYKTGTGLFSLSEEERLSSCSKGGKAAAIVNKQLGRGCFDPEVRKRQHETLKNNQLSAYYDPVLKQEICSKGGKASIFTKAYAEKHGISEEERIEAQRDRGRRGGPKNKGFRWYTDETKGYKYTSREQDDLSFEDFLLKNPQYTAGRPKSSSVSINNAANKGSKYYTDGLINKKYTVKDNEKVPFDKFLKENPQYRRGMVKNKWYNNGHSNFKYTPKEQITLSFEDFIKNNPEFKKGKI